MAREAIAAFRKIKKTRDECSYHLRFDVSQKQMPVGARSSQQVYSERALQPVEVEQYCREVCSRAIADSRYPVKSTQCFVNGNEIAMEGKDQKQDVEGNNQ
jgi:hypothetical protein